MKLFQSYFMSVDLHLQLGSVYIKIGTKQSVFKDPDTCTKIKHHKLNVHDPILANQNIVLYTKFS